MKQPIEEKVAALEQKVELILALLEQYEAARSRLGQFTEEVQAAIEKLQRIEE